MRCRNYIMLLWVLLAGCLAGVRAEETYPHENILSLRYGGMWQQDQYFSPLLYEGMEAGIGNEWWQAFRRNGRWEHMGRLDLTFGWLLSEKRSNRLYGLDIEAGWGAMYRWDFAFGTRHAQQVQLLLGPYAAIDWAPRMLVSNVNKPYSMDAAAEVQALAGVRYTLTARRTAYRLSYIVRANVIGADFMPDYWQSYYELTEGVRGDIRCAGMWNRRYLHHELTLDILCPHSSWRVGLRHEYLEYGQGAMWFSREQVAVVLGTCFRYGVKALEIKNK